MLSYWWPGSVERIGSLPHCGLKSLQHQPINSFQLSCSWSTPSVFSVSSINSLPRRWAKGLSNFVCGNISSSRLIVFSVFELLHWSLLPTPFPSTPRLVIEACSTFILVVALVRCKVRIGGECHCEPCLLYWGQLIRNISHWQGPNIRPSQTLNFIGMSERLVWLSIFIPFQSILHPSQNNYLLLRQLGCLLRNYPISYLQSDRSIQHQRKLEPSWCFPSSSCCLLNHFQYHPPQLYWFRPELHVFFPNCRWREVWSHMMAEGSI